MRRRNSWALCETAIDRVIDGAVPQGWTVHLIRLLEQPDLEPSGWDVHERIAGIGDNGILPTSTACGKWTYDSIVWTFQGVKEANAECNRVNQAQRGQMRRQLLTVCSGCLEAYARSKIESGEIAAQTPDVPDTPESFYAARG